MISLADPVLVPFIEDSAWAPLADVLIDQGATRTDIALLFAGTPPAHQDGLHQEVVAAYMGAMVGEQEMAAVRSVRLVKSMYCGPEEDEPTPCWHVYIAGRKEDRYDDRQSAVRLLKRHVLALSCFAAVRVERQAEVSAKVWVRSRVRDNLYDFLAHEQLVAARKSVQDALQAAGFVPNIGSGYAIELMKSEPKIVVFSSSRQRDTVCLQQVLTAQELIWLETAQNWPTPDGRRARP